MLSLWKTPTGKERKNNPFGLREQDALENFEYFTLDGFKNIGRSYDFYVPIYGVTGTDSYFQYYYDGEVNIIGAKGKQLAKGGEISEAKLKKMLKDDDVSWSSDKEFFEIAHNHGWDYDDDEETFVPMKTYNEGSYSDKDEFAKGGVIAQETPCCGTVRKDFYEGETKNLNEKSGTGYDNRKNYYVDGINVRANTEEEALRSGGVDDKSIVSDSDIFFLTNEEVFVDYTDKDGNKVKRYMLANNPDEVVTLLKRKYKAKSIQGIAMKWELEGKGLDEDKYSN
tara:strand:- start:221 stop:1066 length:846 start_codon:yes stop_codon:yes gene_type:complete